MRNNIYASGCGPSVIRESRITRPAPCMDLNLKWPESSFLLAIKGSGVILRGNRTRQGYARKRILKPAGHFFLEVRYAS